MDILEVIQDGLSNAGSVSIAGLVAIGVMVLEGPTLAMAGVLASLGEIPLAAALIGAVLGIFVADVFFFALGRILGGRILSSSLLGRLFGRRIEQGQEWVTRYGTAAMFATRFLPGSRTAAHAAAGALGMAWGSFLWVAALAAVIYAHLVILLVYALGPGVARWFEGLGGHPVLAALGAILLLTVLGRLMTLLPFAKRRKAGKTDSTDSTDSDRDHARGPDRAIGAEREVEIGSPASSRGPVASEESDSSESPDVSKSPEGSTSVDGSNSNSRDGGLSGDLSMNATSKDEAPVRRNHRTRMTESAGDGGSMERSNGSVPKDSSSGDGFSDHDSDSTVPDSQELPKEP